jgi:hypothetical protein
LGAAKKTMQEQKQNPYPAFPDTGFDGAMWPLLQRNLHNNTLNVAKT